MDLFWTNVLLTFVLGAIVVAGATVLGERLGTKIGGLIGTLPHLVIIALYFIGITQTPEVAAQATVSIPATMGVNVIFLFIFYRAAKRCKYRASVVSLCLWTLMVLPIVIFDLDDLVLSTILYIVLVVVAYYMFERMAKVPSGKKGDMSYSPSVLAVRGILGGGVIALAVVLAKFSGPVVGGIFSVFPALFISTMLIYTFEHGAGYAGAMGKTMSIGGTSVVVYACAGYFLFPAYGMALGSLIGFVISVLAAMAIFPLIKKMR
jgi:uncharacterized membrane protein (GlpM family)